MRTRVVAFLLIALVIAGLFAAKKIRAPKPAPPKTEQIWAQEGVPVKVSTVLSGDIEQTVEVTGDIDALNKVTLSAKIAGRVAAVYAREGDVVTKGMTVVMLDQADAQNMLKQAESALETAQLRLSQARTTARATRVQTDSAIAQAREAVAAAEAQLAVVKQPVRSQEQMVAENALAAASANLENAEANYRRHERLLNEGAISQAAFDAARVQYKVAVSEHKSAQDRLDMIKEGGRAENIRAAQAQLASAKAQLRSAIANASQNDLRLEDVKQAEAGVRNASAALALARQQLSYTYVKSPISGRLASRLAEPGQVVAPGQPLGEVVDLGSLYFKGEISEKEFAGVKKGQSVAVRVDALGDAVFDGRVAELFPSGSTLSRNFPVRISIGNGENIRPGMFARGIITTGYSRGVLLVPKDAIEERKGSRMVFVVKPQKANEKGRPGAQWVARRHDIETVRESNGMVQVKEPSTLRPGDTVVTSGRQNLEDGTKVSIKRG